MGSERSKSKIITWSFSGVREGAGDAVTCLSGDGGCLETSTKFRERYQWVSASYKLIAKSYVEVTKAVMKTRWRFRNFIKVSNLLKTS